MVIKTSFRRIFAARRRVTALASLIWLNMAIGPCAMALQQEAICPDCPPGHSQQMASHHGHDESDSAPSCNTAQTDCCDFGDFTVDDRGQKSGKNGGEQFALVPVLETVKLARHVRLTVFVTGPPDPAPGTQRLHAIYCVYLN